MLRYVKYPDIIDLDRLPTRDEFISYYEKDIPERHSRIEDMWKLFERKVNLVHEFQKRKGYF